MKFNVDTEFHLTNRWKPHSLLASGTFNFLLKAVSRAEMRAQTKATTRDDVVSRRR